MRRFLVFCAVAFGLGGVGSLSTTVVPTAVAQQAMQRTTAVFEIKNMTCALCPLTVKHAMKKVRGVKSVKVNFKSKTATVVFDPTVTDFDDITSASTNAGYPARIKG